MTDGLDAVARGPVGSRLDLGIAADMVGGYGYLDASSRLDDRLAAFARAELGIEWATRDPYARAIAGLRVRL